MDYNIWPSRSNITVRPTYIGGAEEDSKQWKSEDTTNNVELATTKKNRVSKAYPSLILSDSMPRLHP